MELKDFVKKFYFHDSYPEKIRYNPEEKQVVMIIHLCNWLQTGYEDYMDEQTLIQLTFNDVPSLECRKLDKIDSNYTFFKASLITNKAGQLGVRFILFHDETAEMIKLRIIARDVEFVELGPDPDFDNDDFDDEDFDIDNYDDWKFD